ncbi:MAG: 16S rRNA (adenine(1518)-N(6)/adenine(1519)-N(6))-dimethyltransferase RsmA [Myxococcota bacterium]
MSRFIHAFRQRASRALGQHFLNDPQTLSTIARDSLAAPGRLVLEIGPGPGVLTHALLQTGARVVAIEKDRRAVAFLETTFRSMIDQDASDRLTIIEGDALQQPPQQLLAPYGEPPYLAAGNLPYNVATAILTLFLDHAHHFERWTFMFQKEVALRLVAKPNSKAYGSLTLAVMARTRPALLRSLPPGAFVPPPKVDSAVVGFDILAPPRLESELQARFEQVARAAFSKRRKTIRNALRYGLAHIETSSLDAMLTQANIDPRQRAEQLSFDAFVALTQALIDQEQRHTPSEPHADNNTSGSSTP